MLSRTATCARHGRRAVTTGLLAGLLVGTCAITPAQAVPVQSPGVPTRYDFGPVISSAMIVAASYTTNGDLLAVDGMSGNVLRIAADGASTVLTNVSGANDVTEDAATGDIYVSTATKVLEVSGGVGPVTVVAGDGGPAGTAGVRVDGIAASAGIVYLADGTHDVVRQVDTVSGTMSTVVGGGGAWSLNDAPGTSIQLDWPQGLALDAEGRLLIPERLRGAVRRWDPTTQIVSTVAGGVTYGNYSGEGGPAVPSGLGGPVDVAVDSAGNILIAAENDRRIRRVDVATQTISTIAGNGSVGPVPTSGAGTSGSVTYVATVAVAPDDEVVFGTGYNSWSGRGNGLQRLVGYRAAPSLTSPEPAAAVLGTSYSHTFTADGSPTARFAVTAGSLPHGLSLNPTTGVLSGTPAAPGASSFTITASNSQGSVDDVVEFSVVAAPVIDPSAPAAATVGTAYSQILTATGFPAPHWAVSAGELPAGLELSSEGEITGTPTVRGTSTFTVRAENSVGADEVALEIAVAAAPVTPPNVVPVTPERVPVKGAPVRNADGSLSYASPDGPTVVSGAIATFYADRGGDTGFLGAPLSAAFEIRSSVGDEALVQRFENGLVYWSAGTGAHEVHGAIRSTYAGTSWERGVLGLPTTDESMTPDGGRFNHFQGGSVYWTPATGAHVVRGAIRGAWAAAGWERSAVGYPTGEEFATRDGGRVQRFSTGLAYWTPALGAHLVHGAFQGYYAGQDWERGALGYPVSNEYPAGDGDVRQDFEGGSLVFDAASGVVRRL